ncbi:MAG: DUF4335 domain-containing protein [Thermosynechococcaceae cyanobacterium]
MPVISRRYTPPTCTLEITAQTSALSRWTRQPVLKSLDFLLSFKELRDRNQQPIEVKGSRDQLDSLFEAVSGYVEQLLGHNLGELPITSNKPLEENIAPEETVEESDKGGADNALPVPLTLPVPVHLRPKSLLSHELVLGTLATETSGQIVQLKASQLFDLATALDEYAAEVETLPTQVPTPIRPAVPAWTRAAGLILLVGGTTFAVTQFFNSGFVDPNLTVSQEEKTAPPAPQASASLPPLPADTPLPSPTQSLPQVPLPRRDAADLIPDEGAPLRQQPNSGDRSRPGSSSNQDQIATLPTLPAPPPLVSVNPKDLQKPDRLQAPTTIAGRTPTELGKTNLDSSAGASEPVEQAASTRAAAELDRESQLVPPAAVTAPVTPSAARQSSGVSKLNETAFDVRPQISQARQYLASRWQAPANLKQTLQYTLVLNSNGSIRQVKPRGQAASQYLSRTPIPAVNQPFVSPLQGKSTSIRVVLAPDSTVQTFLESSP